MREGQSERGTKWERNKVRKRQSERQTVSERYSAKERQSDRENEREIERIRLERKIERR